MEKIVSRRVFLKNCVAIVGSVIIFNFSIPRNTSGSEPSKSQELKEIAKMSGNTLIKKNKSNPSDTQTAIQIRMTANGKTTVFELNNSPAARDLHNQLPLNISVENYSNNEKIFYPPEKLDTSNTPLADAQAGTLAYYAPWGNVVMFYGKFGSAAGLYELGHAISGSEHIRGISDTVKVEKFVVIEH